MMMIMIMTMMIMMMMMFQARDSGPLQDHRGDPLQRGAGGAGQALLAAGE